MKQRIIKFRGKPSNAKCEREWVFGGLFYLRNNPWICSNTDGYMTEVRNQTVGMFTGRYDISGREIYEGDIVRTPKHEGQIKWMDGKCCFQIHPHGVFLSRDIEIIGNIYDNQH